MAAAGAPPAAAAAAAPLLPPLLPPPRAGAAAAAQPPAPAAQGAAAPGSPPPSAGGAGAQSGPPSGDPAAGASVAGADGKRVVRRKKKKRRTVIAIHLGNCKYALLRSVQRRLGWREVGGDDDEWHVYWTDTSVSMERVMRLRRVQRINHFAGMLEICRKKSLAKNLGRMQKLAPDEYGFSPRSFQLPAEMDELLAQFERGKRKTFILKPDAGCQGKGITLVQSAAAVEAAMRSYAAHSCSNLVAQRYLHKPFLVNGHKFDLRLYVLVLSVDPLRIFLYDEGLVRFCTEAYAAPKSSNLDQVCMHLTNYAVNKHNENFKFNEGGVEGKDDADSKWALSTFVDYLASEGQDVDALWAKIKDLVIKTLISAQPLLAHNYRQCTAQHEDDDGFKCFELLGLDVMLDWKLRPWLIEVNHSPSFQTDTALDLQIKTALIEDTLALAKVDRAAVNKARAAERSDMRRRLYTPKRRATDGGGKDGRSGGGKGGRKAEGKGEAAAQSRTGSAASSAASRATKGAAKGAAKGIGDNAAAAAPAGSGDRRGRARDTRDLEARVAYEDANCGGFQRIYPVLGANENSDDQLATSLAERYARLLEVSKGVFDRHSCIGRTQAALDRKSASMRRVAERGGPPPPTVPRSRAVDPAKRERADAVHGRGTGNRSGSRGSDSGSYTGEDAPTGPRSRTVATAKRERADAVQGRGKDSRNGSRGSDSGSYTGEDAPTGPRSRTVATAKRERADAVQGRGKDSRNGSRGSDSGSYTGEEAPSAAEAKGAPSASPQASGAPRLASASALPRVGVGRQPCATTTISRSSSASSVGGGGNGNSRRLAAAMVAVRRGMAEVVAATATYVSSTAGARVDAAGRANASAGALAAPRALDTRLNRHLGEARAMAHAGVGAGADARAGGPHIRSSMMSSFSPARRSHGGSSVHGVGSALRSAVAPRSRRALVQAGGRVKSVGAGSVGGGARTTLAALDPIGYTEALSHGVMNSRRSALHATASERLAAASGAQWPLGGGDFGRSALLVPQDPQIATRARSAPVAGTPPPSWLAVEPVAASVVRHARAHAHAHPHQHAHDGGSARRFGFMCEGLGVSGAQQLLP